MNLKNQIRPSGLVAMYGNARPIELPPEAVAALASGEAVRRMRMEAAGGAPAAAAPADDDLTKETDERLLERLEASRKLEQKMRADLTEGGPLSARAERRLDEAEESILALEAEIDRRHAVKRHPVRNDAQPRTPGRKTTHELVDDASGYPGTQHPTRAEWRDSEGKPVAVLNTGESLAKLAGGGLPRAGARTSFGGRQQQPAPRVGEVVRAMITGDWERVGEMKNALSEGIDTAGGYLVVPQVAGQLIDLARDRSVVMSAGARTVSMNTEEMILARVTEDPTVSCVPEGGNIPKTEAAFGALRMRARKMAAIVPMTRELAEDAPNTPDVIESMLANAMAAELDRAALFGTGKNGEPVGLFNAPGVQTIASVGALNYDDILTAIALIEAQNGDPNAWVTNAANKAALAKLKDSTGLYLNAPADVVALKRLVTNKLTDAQAAVGDFRQMLIGVRLRGVQIEITTTGGDAFDLDLMAIKARWRGDVAFAHPEHFVTLSGITIS